MPPRWSPSGNTGAGYRPRGGESTRTIHDWDCVTIIVWVTTNPSVAVAPVPGSTAKVYIVFCCLDNENIVQVHCTL